jgi:CHAD domain-containing protein
MAVTTQEIETKYDVPAGAVLSGLGGLPGVAHCADAPEQQLDAEYFDTDDLRLIRAGITLRRRTGGSDAGWHLKLPAGPRTRSEIRLPLGRATRRVPAELAELVTARARDKSLQPIASLTTRRRTTTLFDQAGNSLAEVAEDDVTGTRPGDPASTSHWREVEVELTGGSSRLLQAADVLLRREGLRPAAYAAKLERVLGTSLPPRSPEPELSRSSPAHEVVMAYLGKHVQALTSLDPMVRGDRPDSVHQMRVATRRLRSTLRTFGAVIGGTGTVALAAELKWLGAVLGEARDAEVQARRLKAQAQQTDVEQLLGPVRARIQAHFAKSQATARTNVLEALTSERYYALLDGLDALVGSPPLGPDAEAPASRVLPAAVGRSRRKTRRRLHRAQQAPPGRARDEALHRARKAAKQARYAAEAAQPAAGRGAARFARQMKRLQSVLGDYQDTVVGRELIRRLGIAADQAGESGFSYGLFYGSEQAEAQRLEARAWRVWHRSTGQRFRKWMDAGS